MFPSRTDISVKIVIFDSTPAEQSFGPRIVVPWNFLKNLISTIWDSVHGGERPSYDLFFSVTDGEYAKP